MHKIIKKKYKILLVVVGVLILLPLLAFLFLQSSRIQTWLIGRVNQSLSESLQADIHVGKVDISFFDKVVFDDVFISDTQGDTLLYSEELIVRVDLLSLPKRKARISEIWISGADLNVVQNEEGQYNFKFLIDAFRERPQDTLRSWDVRLSRIHLLNSDLFLHRSGDIKTVSTCFDPSNLFFRKTNLSIKRIEQKTDTLSFQVYGGQFEISDEFAIRGFESIVEATPGQVVLKRFFIKTDESEINLNNSRLDITEYQKSRDVKDLQFNLDFTKSFISLSDLGCFVPAFIGMNSVIGFSGDFKGKLSNFRAKKFSLSNGQNIQLYGDISMNGLPKLDETFLFLDFYESTLDLEGISKIRLPNSSKNEYLHFPDNFYNVGIFEFKGKFSGFFKDFVAYGSLKSDLGELNTDVAFKVDDQKEEVQFRGQVSTDNFQLGELMNTTQLGVFAFSGQVNGDAKKDGSIQAYMDGLVSSLELNNYMIHDIVLKGELSENKFDGSLLVEDPNLDLDFKGKVDFTQVLPQFNFMGDLRYGNMSALNLLRNKKIKEIGFMIDADFVGLDFDDLNGNIHLNNFWMNREEDKVEVEDLKLSIFSKDNVKYAQLRSDFIDGNMKGKFVVASFGKAFKNYISNYIPNTGIGVGKDFIMSNIFDFDIHVKKVNPLAQFISPNLNFRTPVKLSGHFNSEKGNLRIIGDVPEALFEKIHVKNLNLSGNGNIDQLKIRLHSASLQFGNNVPFYNFTINTGLLDNDVRFNISWSNWGEKTYSGLLGSTIHFNERKNNKKSIDIDIQPSRIYVADTLWKIDQTKIEIDSTRYHFDHFRLHHNNEIFEMHGAVSEDKKEYMEMNFEQINLNSLDLFVGKDLELDGILTGNARLYDFYEKRLFYSDLSIDRIGYRGQDFGNISLTSKWDQESQTIFSDLSLIKDKEKTLNVFGNFSPSTKMMDFSSTVNGLPLDFLYLFMHSFTDYVDGQGYGDLRMHGPVNHPLFDGKIKTENASIGISYLKTGFAFSDEVLFSGDSIIFDQITLNDKDGNTGVLDGEIVHTFFHDLHYNLGVNTDRLLALNTTSVDNELFYGTAYASGAFRLTGFGKTIHTDVSIRSEKGTRFFIPLENPESINEAHFVRFVSRDTTEKVLELQALQEPSGFTMNLDVEATPDAKIQLIFDVTTGDIIKGEGNGNIKMVLDKEGNFKMYGDYQVESGDYLFTLQNVINKKFKVKQGGTVIWTGDPYNAEIDIDAAYRLKASLYDLFLDTYGDIYNKRVQVECIIHLTDNLMNPKVSFDIDFPNSEDRLKDDVQQFVNTEEDLNRQIMYLLVLGQFYTPDYMRGSSSNGSSSTDLVGSTVSDVFSNQLSNWLSQLSSDIDIGLNYRPGTELSGREIEVALSTQILDDRVIINGNIGNDATSTNASRIVGDVEINVKLDKKGKVQLKAYTRSNDNLIYDTSPYTQGVGVSYREEFKTWKELWKRYTRIFSRKKKNVKSD